ncbi:hypothetical protein PTTW11_04960 [Pyrenophora teres f. teres]|uniref:Uncharacterized protein n=1 Tax=Pyrenophora teres f. teres TaxID=97479 RepID=A0A6S6W0B2_9PLEO|nr:hypothetical protein PTTW11_04960 [Pyrenophora teres f. teres]
MNVRPNCPVSRPSDNHGRKKESRKLRLNKTGTSVPFRQNSKPHRQQGPKKHNPDASDGPGNRIDLINLSLGNTFLFPILVEDDSIPSSSPSPSQNNPTLWEIL